MRLLLYQSDATSEQFSLDDLDVLRIALQQNAKHGVTGFLYRSKSAFFQAIEGEPETIEQLVKNLKADRRHSNLRVLLDQTVAERVFSDWSMGYASYKRAGRAGAIEDDMSAQDILTCLIKEATGASAQACRKAGWENGQLSVRAVWFAASTKKRAPPSGAPQTIRF